ncbi:MAG: Cna B-type domain-containing protein, partial [Firmicutes bacterium]|nr:Cna B-type domain-containing protein [Bacillota bacterium]
DKPQRFDNTAQVTSVRGQDVKLVSETTHHRTEPLVDVHATKTWAGGVEADHGEVTLQLLRSVDGGEPEPVGEPITTNGLSATWEGVSTYDAQGREYAYSVAELSATGERLAEGDLRGNYRVSYGTNTEDGTLTVTNSYVEPPAKPSEPTLPRTGDVSLAAPYVLTAFGLALALAGVLRKKGRKA